MPARPGPYRPRPGRDDRVPRWHSLGPAAHGQASVLWSALPLQTRLSQRWEANWSHG